MKRSMVWVCVAFFLFSSFGMHPLKMSIGEVTYKDKKIELKFRFFTDDLEYVLSKYFKSEIDILNNGIQSNDEAAIRQYIAAKFAMDLNGTRLNWVYKKAYPDRDVTCVEFTAPVNKINKVRSVKVMNKLLFDDNFPGMKNVMRINLLNEKKVMEFDNDEEEYIKEIMY